MLSINIFNVKLFSSIQIYLVCSKLWTMNMIILESTIIKGAIPQLLADKTSCSTCQETCKFVINTSTAANQMLNI